MSQPQKIKIMQELLIFANLNQQFQSEYKSIKTQIKNFSQELSGLGSKELSLSERKRFHDRYKRIIESTRRIDFNKKDYKKLCETISEFRKKFQHLGFIDDDISTFNMSDTHSPTRRYNLRSSTREHTSSTSEQKKYKSDYYVTLETKMESVIKFLQNSNMKLISLDSLNTYKKMFNAIGKDVSERRDISKEECEELSRLYDKYVTQFRKLAEEIERKIADSDTRNEHVPRWPNPKSAETQSYEPDNNTKQQTNFYGCWRSPKSDEDSESKIVTCKSNTYVVTIEPKITSENEKEEIKKHQSKTIDLPHVHSFGAAKDEWNVSKGNVNPSKESSTIDWNELKTSNYLPVCEENPHSKREEEPSDITNSASYEEKANKYQTKPHQSFYNMGLPFKGKRDVENEVEAEETLQRSRENANLNRKERRETAAMRIQRSVADELLKEDQQRYLYQLGKNYRVHKNDENVEDMNQPSHLNYSKYDRTYLESSRWKTADEKNTDCKPSKPSQDYGCALVLNPLQTTRMAAFQSHSKHETQFSKDHINVDSGVIHKQPTASKSPEESIANVSQTYGKDGNELSKDYSNIQSYSANYLHSKDHGDSTKDNSNVEAEFNVSRHHVQNSNQIDQPQRQSHDQYRHEVRGRGKLYRQSFEEQNEVPEENLRKYHQYNDYRNYSQHILNPLQTTRMTAFQSHSKHEIQFSKDHINVDSGVIHKQSTASKSPEESFANVSQTYGKDGNELSKDYSNIQSYSANYLHSKDHGDSAKDNSNIEAEFNVLRHHVQNSNQRDESQRQSHDQHRHEVRGRGKLYRQFFEEQNEVSEENLRKYLQYNDYRNYSQYNRNPERYESYRPSDYKHYAYNNYESSSQIQNRRSLPNENYNDETTIYTHQVQDVQEVKTEEPLEILDVHKYFRDDFDLNSLDSLDDMDRIDSIETYARTFEDKVNAFDEERDSLEYFLLDEKLLRLIEKLDKIKCREDQATTHRKVEVIQYIKNLCTVLDQRAKDE